MTYSLGQNHFVRLSKWGDEGGLALVEFLPTGEKRLYDPDNNPPYPSEPIPPLNMDDA